MLRVTFPEADEVDRLAALQPRHVAEHDGLVAGLRAQFRDGEVGLLIQPQDALHHARKLDFGPAGIFARR
jgi:hypothetical protein